MSIVDFKSNLALDEKFSKQPNNIFETKLEDVKRVTKFMYGTTGGALFIAKQVGLQLMNPQQESNGINQFSPFSNNSHRIYNLGVNTLAQVAVQGTGIHLDRHGLLPVNEESTKHYKAEAALDVLGKSRLLNLHSKLIKPIGNNIIDPVNGRSFKTNQQDIVLSYGGGTGSVLGVGKTEIKRDFNTTNSSIRVGGGMYSNEFVQTNADGSKNTVINYYDQLGLSKLMYNSSDLLLVTGIDEARPTLEPEQLRNVGPTNVVGKPLFKSHPAGSELYSPYSGTNVYPSGDTRMKDLNLSYIDKRVGLQSTNGDQHIDTINLTNIYSSDDSDIRDKETNDLVRIKIEAIDNKHPDKTEVMAFRCYNLVFDNQSQAKFNTVRYLGRGDNFYVVDGYEESYSIGFDIFSMSAGEMLPLYRKLNFLKSTLAPDYHGTKMAGSFVKMTIGNLLHRVPGYIASLNINIPDTSPWDIDIPFDEQGGVATQLPRHLKLSMSFIPIQSHLVKKGKNVPFISVDKIGFLS